MDEPAEILNRIEYGFGMRRSFSPARRGKDGRSAENRAIILVLVLGELPCEARAMASQCTDCFLALPIARLSFCVACAAGHPGRLYFSFRATYPPAWPKTTL